MHWTGGTHKVSSLDRKHYHSIFAGDGTRVVGMHSHEDNKNTADGIYAAHTFHMNTNFVGVSIACMGGKDVKEKPLAYGKWPPTKKEVDAMCKHVAKICDLYGIKITKKTVLCHSEVQKNIGIKQRGKWDINCLPWVSGYGSGLIGDYLRNQISEELHFLQNPPPLEPFAPEPVPVPEPKPRLPPVPVTIMVVGGGMVGAIVA